jgi:hypothetical protein
MRRAEAQREVERKAQIAAEAKSAAKKAAQLSKGSKPLEGNHPASQIAYPTSVPSSFKPSLPASAAVGKTGKVTKGQVFGKISGSSHESSLAKDPNYDKKGGQPTFLGPCWLGEDDARKQWGYYPHTVTYRFEAPVEYANKFLHSSFKIPDMPITRWDYVKLKVEQHLFNHGLAYLDQSSFPGSRTIDYNQFLVSYFYRREYSIRTQDCIEVVLYQVIRTVGEGIKRQLHWDRMVTRGNVKSLVPSSWNQIPDMTERSNKSLAFWSFGFTDDSSSFTDNSFDSQFADSSGFDHGGMDYGGASNQSDFSSDYTDFSSAASSSAAPSDFSTAFMPTTSFGFGPMGTGYFGPTAF